MEARIRDDVCWIVGFVRGSFPGTNPVSITNQNLEILNQNDYYVSSKTDGERKLIYSNGLETFLIDRKFRLAKVNNIITTRGKTLLDAEEIEENGKIIFLVFDAVMINDWYIGNDNLNNRLYWVSTVLPKYSETIMIKKMYNVNQTFSVYHQKQNHRTDGLIFTNIYSPYRGGRCETLLKYKDISHNTIDFKTNIKDGKVELYIGVLGQPTKFVGHLDTTVEKFSEQYSSGDIIECQYLTEVLYKPLRKRCDKDLPNDIKVFTSVLQSIKHGITMEDVLRQCRKHKRRYSASNASVQLDPLGSLFPDD